VRIENIVSIPFISGHETQGAARSDAARVHPRDLVALLGLPLLWKDKDPGEIARGLVEVVDRLLQPDCAFVRMGAEGEPALVERLPAACAFTAALAHELEPSTAAASGGEWSAGSPGIRIARAQRYFPGEHCLAVATSRRADFPLPADLFVLQQAVDQAAIAFHGARLVVREKAARRRAEILAKSEEQARAEAEASRTMQARVTGLADEWQWLESLLDLLPVPVLLVEPATTRVAFSNKAADRVAGGTYPRSALGGEAEGYSYSDADGRPVPKERHPLARAARGEGVRTLELDWHTPSGSRSLLLSSALLQAAHGHPATAMLAFEDVSELKQTQSALRAALAESSKFVSVTEESSDFIAIASLDLEVQFVNRGGQALVGLDGAGRVRRTTIPDYLFPSPLQVGRRLWELPAGRLDPGESPLQAAKRELAEETGYRARKWKKLVSFYPSPGYVGEKMTIFLATGLTAGKPQPMDDERIEARWFQAAEIERMLRSGKISDGKTMIGYLMWKTFR